MPISNPQRGVVLYDFFQVLGGAERVAADLVDHYGADLVLGFDDLARKGFSFDDRTFQDVIDLDARSTLLPVQLMRLCYAFYRKTQFLDRYDWAIYSGAYAPLAVRNQTKGKRVLYCHTPPRFLYDREGQYLNQYGPIKGAMFSCFTKFFKPLYEEAFRSMDVVIANSENVRRRIKHYLGADSITVHPPCLIEGKRWGEPQGYYLSLARLEPYKRVDLLVEAFLQMPPKQLVVASGGSDLERLKALAAGAENIHFTGWTSQEELDRLISGCIASLYIPIDEDFGMSPVESMAAGKPVIGVKEGGLVETVVPGETGILVEGDLKSEVIIDAVERLSVNAAFKMKQACLERAALFDRKAFFKKMDQLIMSSK